MTELAEMLYTLEYGQSVPASVFVQLPNTFECRKARWDKGDVPSRPATGHTFPSSETQETEQ